MKYPAAILIALLSVLINNQVTAQDSLLTQLAKNNISYFTQTQGAFSGAGWETIVEQAQKSNFVLIGEDHFTNEIPLFTSALSDRVKFDNFFCEIDPYSAKIIESKIKTNTEKQLDNYVANYGNTFSFFALRPEFVLIKNLVKHNTSIYGTDQIVSVADRLICSELKKITQDETARKVYETIEEQSKLYFEAFLKDQSQPFYLMTEAFEANLAQLTLLKLSPEEKEKIEALKLTAKIYKAQDHHLRIQLMKNQLMKQYPEWRNKKNLFKFGAVHLAKGESLLKIYDLGNLINNVADSKFQDALHVMIVGKSGFQGSPFNGMPAQALDENNGDLSVLQPFFKAVKGEQWHNIDIRPIRKAIEEQHISVNNQELLRIINGYDFVVIIPTVSAAQFPTQSTAQ